MLFSKYYSLRKSRHVFHSGYKLYKKKAHSLSPAQADSFKNQLQELDTALKSQNRTQADALAREVEKFCDSHFSKTWLESLSELGMAIAIALIIAIIVRSSWFEPYEIPTGSMRPTFEEQDRLTVSKTAFGINIPLMTGHFYFDPHLVQRSGVVIWSGDPIPFLDTESTFLGIFPYTKRFIKRCMAKPGDTLYFYGGKIYGVDREGRELTELLHNPWMTKLEHIPFMHFEGRVSSKQSQKDTQLHFHQINQLIGRLSVNQKGQITGEILADNTWLKDNPEAQKEPHATIKTYSDFWGIRNFAMAKLLTKEQVEKQGSHNMKDIESAPLYLELKHTPSVASGFIELSHRSLSLTGFTTLIPLQESHCKALMDNMYTARFVVKDGLAERYQLENSYHLSLNSPRFPGIPDGTYEFYYGKGYQVGWQGILSELPQDHPLNQFSVSLLQKLFNHGIEMSPGFHPIKQKNLFPNRYAYFRNGELYLLGAAIFKATDPTLKAFQEREVKKQEESKSDKPYVAFRDYGPPLKDGKIDLDFLKVFGYHVPEERYLVLGDNHAMSQDSRYFGPIPQANLQGVPSYIIWPPGKRWGCPNQKPYPFLTLPRIFVWSTALLVAAIWYIAYRRRWSNLKW